MHTIGGRLRSAREQQGINLAQAASETRIGQRYLVALEEGDVLRLLGDVYVCAYVRT